MPFAGIILEHRSEGDLVVEWRISNYFTLSEEDGTAYSSPLFSFGGEGWSLGISPNGSRERDSSGHVDLHICKWSIRCIKQIFSLSLKTVKGEKYNQQHGTRDFEVGWDNHEFNRFIPRSELTMKSSELVPEGVLTVVCTMKGSPSAESENNSPSASAECRHCKRTFNADSLSLHQKKCKLRPTKCPECLEVVALLKWINEHDCQRERPQAGKEHKENSGTTGVNASTQTEERDSEVCISGFSISAHEKKVLHDFKKLFLQKEDSDVIIKIKGSEFKAHRLVLKARSPVFASTFRHDMKESSTGVVEIEDCDPSSFSDFLRYLYCGDINMISPENVFGLFTLADKYEILDLRSMCLDFIQKNLMVETFCETITLALQHSETELIALATDFFVQNAEEILLSVKWQTFVSENPTQSNELVIKFVRSVKH